MSLVGGPLKLLALSLSSTLVGGGGGKPGINGLKTPLNHKRAHIRCKVSELYLSGLQWIPTQSNVAIGHPVGICDRQ